MSMKLGAALGFCAKAGKVKSGEFIVEKALKSGAAKLIIADSLSSDATRNRWSEMCARRSVPYTEIENAGKYMGKPHNKLFAVTDDGFRNMIVQAQVACNNTETTREVEEDA